jgi:hypothetical protein
MMMMKPTGHAAFQNSLGPFYYLEKRHTHRHAKRTQNHEKEIFFSFGHFLFFFLKLFYHRNFFSVVHLRRVVFRLWRRPCACSTSNGIVSTTFQAARKKKKTKIPMKLEYYREKIAARQSITAAP